MITLLQQDLKNQGGCQLGLGTAASAPKQKGSYLAPGAAPSNTEVGFPFDLKEPHKWSSFICALHVNQTRSKSNQKHMCVLKAIVPRAR